MEFSEKLVLGFAWYVVFLFSIVCHEAAHALVAMWLGDRTAYFGGQVTLDPLPHIRREPFGTVLVPILTYFYSGWMLGWASAPVDAYWANRYPRRAAIVSLAGPVANLILFLIAVIGIRAGMWFGILDAPERVTFGHVTEATRAGLAGGIAVLLGLLFSLNLLLAVFNMLPVPPLDGSNVVTLLMNRRMADQFQELRRNPTFLYIGLIAAVLLGGQVVWPIHTLALNVLYPGHDYHAAD